MTQFIIGMFIFQWLKEFAMKRNSRPEVNRNRPHTPIKVVLSNQNSVQLGIAEALWNKNFKRAQELSAVLEEIAVDDKRQWSYKPSRTEN
jgi:hypothetical protein